MPRLFWLVELEPAVVLVAGAVVLDPAVVVEVDLPVVDVDDFFPLAVVVVDAGVVLGRLAARAGTAARPSAPTSLSARSLSFTPGISTRMLLPWRDDLGLGHAAAS